MAGYFLDRYTADRNLGPRYQCKQCGLQIERAYCRDCDMYVDLNHVSDCKDTYNNAADHADHRLQHRDDDVEKLRYGG